jgi:hypothetical protein
MVMLYDGYCASTCTVFSELMKTLGGVQSIAVGGRPQLAAMQGVGGVKGSNVQEFNNLIGLALGVFGIANQSILDEVGHLGLWTSQPANYVAGHRHRLCEHQRAANSAFLCT